MFTAVYALYRKEGTTREEFEDYWLNVHAPFGAKLPHVLSYRIMPVSEATNILGLEADGFAIVECESQEEFELAAASEEMAAAGVDAAKFARHFDVYTGTAHTII
jgi:uncharacterized protein (TIGR02118 family)